jgi:C_GCAxxG_C_C family probable redox protein
MIVDDASSGLGETNLAVQYFQAGYNCSQAVFCAFAPKYGLSVEQAFRLASGLGGGIGNTGETCGVLTGAAMVIGLHYSSGIPGEQKNKEQVYTLVQRLLSRFVQVHASPVCRVLKEPALGDPVARRKLCERYVEEAAKILESILSEAD